MHTDLAPAPGSTTIEVALKIWRYDAVTGDKELKRYEVEAPDWVTLLDVLDIIKDKHDGTLAYRKSCRMMICGSCGMRMDGAAVLACKTRMYDIAKSGHVPVIAPMGNLPVRKDLVVDMDPFWNKIRRMKPWLDPGYEEPPEKEWRVSQEKMNVIHKEALCIMCGCCVSECNSMESDPEFFGPAALAKGMRFIGDARDQANVTRLEDYNDEHGIWDCTRCYFCNERCPKGVDPRDAIAKLGAESIKEGIDHDMGAKHANWFVTSARDDRLAAGNRARAEDTGNRRGDQADEVRDQPREARQGAAAGPTACRRAGERVALALLAREGAGTRRRARDRAGGARARPDRVHRAGRPEGERSRGATGG